MNARLTISGWTETGPREQNEDYFLCDKSLGAAIVADGLGGAELGSVCSRGACIAAMRALKSGSSVASAVDAANDAVLTLKALLDGEFGAGTTILVAHLNEKGLDLAWVGDTLAFGIRGGDYQMLTESGRIVPWLSVLDSALGQDEPIVRSCCVCDVLPGDRFLLLTDGVWDSEIDVGKIVEIASQEPSRAAMTLALRASTVGNDNATAVVIEVK